MNIKTLLTFLFLVTIIIFGNSCKENTPEINMVTKKKEITKIVSLSPALTELLFHLNVQDKLVGRTDACTIPKEAASIPIMGNFASPYVEKILKVNPDLIINQGCAGGHVSKLKLGDIVIGESSKYINDFKTPIKQIGEGSNSLTWTPHTSRSYVSHSTPKYVDIAKQVKTSQQIYLGTLGSADTHSRECDRINYLHSLFDHLCEDMESAAAMKACSEFNVDRIAFRIISNNDLTSIQFDKSPLKLIQQFVIDFINLLN
jgi:hypothetical protein